MPALKGNTYAKGNRGGGRKSAYEEGHDAAWLCDVWNSPQDYEELKEKIVVSKRYSVRDMVQWKALNGDTQILKVMADKMLPDKLEMRSEITHDKLSPEDPFSAPYRALTEEFEGKLRELMIGGDA